MRGSKRRVYWDANVFISWLSEQDRTPDEMAGIQRIANRFDGNEIVLVTSVLTKIEVLECKMPEGGEEKFNEALMRSNVVKVDVQEPIADLAHKLRDYYQREGPKLSLPDAVHLATAIWAKVDVFQTFDGCGGDSGLIDLDGNVAGHSLKIATPDDNQLSLDLRYPTDGDKEGPDGAKEDDG